MSAADLRESVVKAILDTQILTLAQIGSPVGIKEGAAARALASAALRAVADAGPTDAMIEAAARVIEQDVKDYSGGFVTVEEAKKIARAALAAAFKTFTAQRGAEG